MQMSVSDTIVSIHCESGLSFMRLVVNARLSMSNEERQNIQHSRCLVAALTVSGIKDNPMTQMKNENERRLLYGIHSFAFSVILRQKFYSV